MFTYDLAELTRFKTHYVASEYKISLTGSYENDELRYPGWYHEVFQLIAIDQYGEELVQNTLDLVNGNG